MEALREGFDNLQEYVQADPDSYPLLCVLELALALAAGAREEMRAHFRARSQAF